MIVALAGSPSTGSRTVALLEEFADWLRAAGHEVRVVAVRSLPAEALISADPADPRVASVVSAIADADGVVVASPVYKAAYSGVLKTFLDLLPQGALAGKTVLPVLMGGAPTHALALDYALRPVLVALGARHVSAGIFVLDKRIERTPAGVTLAADVRATLESTVDEFTRALPTPAAR